MGRVTLALGSHRVETLALAEPLMAQHQLIVLEEPPEPSFAAVLGGQLPLADYLEETAAEFPRYAAATLRLLRKLHRQGAVIVQCEPYLQLLAEVHELFEQGGRPADIAPGSLLEAVYRHEQQWTAALLCYYGASATKPFGEVVDAVVRFARADGARGRLRDRLRAAAITALWQEHAGASAYVEAGYLHHALLLELRRRLPRGALSPRWLLEPVCRPELGCRQLLSPGDRLTLQLSLRPAAPSTPRTTLLAARSLVFVKLIDKHEVLPTPETPYPHHQAELEAARLVGGLSYDDCRQLFGEIRQQTEAQAACTVRSRVPTTVSSPASSRRMLCSLPED